MEISVFEYVTELYRYVNSCLPVHESNPCNSCNICCHSVASLGVSEMEYDYMESYLFRNGKDSSKVADFRNYVNSIQKEPQKRRTCPFYSEILQGCSIYEARTLSCRTFGYFINEDSMHLIPDCCNLKKDVTVYSADTFAQVMPFVLPFYRFIERYDVMKKQLQHCKAEEIRQSL